MLEAFIIILEDNKRWGWKRVRIYASLAVINDRKWHRNRLEKHQWGDKRRGY